MDFAGDELANVLEIGDNLAVNVEDGNLEGMAFYLILCTKALHKVKEAFQIIGGQVLMLMMML